MSRPYAAAPATAEVPTSDPPRFAVTKIQPPRPRARRIERPTLEQALVDAVHGHRVVLLQAPAGYGKSSLLASLVQRLAARADGTALAWVSLDEDDDAARLFACIAAALDPVDLPWRTSPDALVAQMQQGPEAARRAVAELLNAMSHADVPHGVIVLEDLHRVRDRELVDLGNLMIDRLPAHWCFVLSSREVPALALARQRAMGELSEFGPDHLRFSAEETQALLAAEGLDAPGLHERTQGWPAGVRLAAMAQRVRLVGAEVAAGAGAAGASDAAGDPARPVRMDRHLFEYLVAEVIGALPAPLHDFLLRTSVLRELTAAPAAAVSGDLHAALRLDEIERRGLFATALDEADRTLVLHDLFRDALLLRLRQRLPGEVPELLRRAAASEPDPLRRIGYLLRAEDWAAAEAELDAAAPALLLHGGVGDVERVIAQFDAAWRQQSPVLNLLAALAACLRWDWTGVERLTLHAARAADSPARTGRADSRPLRQQADGVRAMALYALDRNDESEALIAALHRETMPARARRVLLMADATQRFRRGEHDTVQHAYAEVLESLLAGATLFEWWECVPAPNWSTLPGMQPLFERFIEPALLQIGQQPLAMRGEVLIQRAFMHLWAGRIDAARADAAAAEDDFRWLACSVEMEMSIVIFRLLEGAMAGRADEVAQRMQRKFERADGERKRLWQHQTAMYGIRTADVLGLPPAVIEHWAQYVKEDPLRSDRHDTNRANAIRARHAAARGAWDPADTAAWPQAAALFEHLLPRLPTFDLMGQHVELRLRTAQAWLRAGRATAEAAAALQPALARIAAEGCIGHALMAGPVVLRELAGHDWGTTLGVQDLAVLRRALALAESLRGGSAAAAAPDTPAGSRPNAMAAGTDQAAAPESELLSSREIEVLALMARGDSNKLIARTLDISPHTVKRHVANILDKLALQSRGQASAWFLQRRPAKAA